MAARDTGVNRATGARFQTEHNGCKNMNQRSSNIDHAVPPFYQKQAVFIFWALTARKRSLGGLEEQEDGSGR